MKKLFCLMLSLIMVFCILGIPAASAADSKDSVIVRCEQVFYNFHPLEGIVGFPNLYVMDQVYEALTRVDDAGVVQPRLAESWTIAEDGKSVSFKLREGVKFHNGEELKASDVIFTYNLAKTTAAMNYYCGNVDRVEANGDYEITIYLTQPSVSFINNVSEVYIMNEKYYNDVGGQLLDQGCGTGPYKFVSVDLANEVELEANEDYWEGSPAIKHVYLRPVTDSTTAAISFEAGELDFMQVSNISGYQPLVDSGMFNTEAITTLHTAYISMNNEVAPFDNKLVRQALTYAADRATMVIIAYEGLADPARLMSSEACFGVDFSEATDYDYNLEKAKELLAEAGYPNGINFKEDFGIVMDIIGGGFYEKFATIFQQSLSEIGCTLELRASETYSSDAASGNYAIITQGMTFGYDFSYAEGLYGTKGINSKNHARYSNPEVDELFLKADQTTDQSERAAYFKQIVNILVDDCPTIPVFHKKMLYAWDENLNAVPHVAANHPYYIYEWSWN